MREIQAFIDPCFKLRGKRKRCERSFTFTTALNSAFDTPFSTYQLTLPMLQPSSIVLLNALDPDDILSKEDIIIGTVLGFALAFLWSFIQRRQSDTNIVLWRQDSDEETDRSTPSKSTTTFDADDWREISREENYVFFNTKVRKQIAGQDKPKSLKHGQKWVLVALMALFVPIFSFEIFLALSRGLLCDDLLSDWDMAQVLCAPHR